MTRTSLVALAFGLAACVPMAPPDVPVATVPLVRSDGASLGTVRVFSEPTGIILRINATGLPAGMHGAHLHAVGRCEGPTFTSAGAHWNPTSKQHGHQNPAGYHAGDLGNLGVGTDGVLTAGLLVPGARVSANSSGEGSVLLDADGAALVIHAQQDDEKTDPSGNSGDRIACAAIGSQMAKNGKLPKRIAGVKIPKKVRRHGGQIYALLGSPVVANIVAAGLIAAADSLATSKTAKKAGKAAKHAAADTGEATVEAASAGAINVASVLAFAAREAARAIKGNAR